MKNNNVESDSNASKSCVSSNSDHQYPHSLVLDHPRDLNPPQSPLMHLTRNEAAVPLRKPRTVRSKSNAEFVITLFPDPIEENESGLAKGRPIGIKTDEVLLLPPPASLLSPRKQRVQARSSMAKKAIFLVSSPIPFLMLALVGAMIVMIFVDVISISGLVCMTAVVVSLIHCAMFYTIGVLSVFLNRWW